MVEPFSIDESWLDVTASQKLFGSGRQIADTIRRTVREELGDDAFGRCFLQQDLCQDGQRVQEARRHHRDHQRKLPRAFVAAAAGELFGVGKATSEKLRQAGIFTIGDIAASKKAAPRLPLRQAGRGNVGTRQRYRRRSGRPVRSERADQICRQRRHLPPQSHKRKRHRHRRQALSDKVAGRLRQHGLKAGGVKVDIKDPYFKVISRQKQLDTTTWLAEEIAQAAAELIRASWRAGCSDPHADDHRNQSHRPALSGTAVALRLRQQQTRKGRKNGAGYGRGAKKIRKQHYRLCFRNVQRSGSRRKEPDD